MSDEREDYPLSNMRYFSSYNKDTKELEYSKYSFNFDLYAQDYSLDWASKVRIFDDFLEKNEYEYSKPTKVKEGLRKYFKPMTQQIKNYNSKYANSVHSGYFNIQGLNTYIPQYDLVNQQFDLIYYVDTIPSFQNQNRDPEIRRLQDYYYNDNFGNIFSKYNFNFDYYSNDFEVYGNKLVIFTDFVTRVLNTSSNISGTRSYGDPNIFRKYFIQSPELKNYLINHSVNSIFFNSEKNIYNFDFIDYSKKKGIDFNNGIDFIYENFIIYGQFEQIEVKFIPNSLNKYESVTSSVAVVKADGIGVGFLYNHYNHPGDIYCITCNHLLGNNNLETFKASFELVDNTNQINAQTAEFRIVGRDIFSDIVVGIFDPEMAYNKIYNIDLTIYKTLTLNTTVPLQLGDPVDLVGHIGYLDNRSFLTGRIIDPKYAGSFFKSGFYIPESVLIDMNIMKGVSGSPLFIEKNIDGSSANKLSLAGMIVARLGTDNQYCIAISAFTLQSTISKIIENYDIYSNYFKDDLVELSNVTKNGITKKWLGITGYYYDPISGDQGNSALNNLPYNGGLVINKFILGFDTDRKTYVYDSESLGQIGVIQINSPLLNTKIYKRFLDSNKTPLVIKSMTFFEGLKGTYNKFYIGKYSNQVGYYIYSYGLLPLGNFQIEDQQSINRIGYTYGKITFEYFYYNGETWILEEETIGGTTRDWYNIYVDSNNKRYYQHKFEFPNILLSYQSSFAQSLFNYTNNTFTAMDECPINAGSVSSRGQLVSSSGQLVGSGQFVSGSGQFVKGSGNGNMLISRQNTIA